MTPDEWMDSEGKPEVPEMTPEERELTARIRETFYAYTNRTDRSQQATLGPSEAGTPCDRRLALHMLGMPPVNPGGDNWASFKGTCVHAGLADMFTWADAGSGRYAVEVPLALPSAIVPSGTADRVDRILCMVLDDKCMGEWSLDKFRRVGPSPTYFVQVHLYAYAARRRGERVDKVAIVAWPINEQSLDNLRSWVRDYDPRVAPRALARVDRLALRVREEEDRYASEHDVRIRPDSEASEGSGNAVQRQLEIASVFEVADDCKFCPYYAPDDSAREMGCNGKR
jgi:hypothetical protein